jgi:hypothetical protein
MQLRQRPLKAAWVGRSATSSSGGRHERDDHQVSIGDGSGSEKSPNLRVCIYCLGWYPELTDFSCYGLDKWCDGCEPILKDLVKRTIDGEKLEEILTQLKSFSPAPGAHRARP